MTCAGFWFWFFFRKKKKHPCFISPSNLAVQERSPKALCVTGLCAPKAQCLAHSACSLTLDDETPTTCFLSVLEGLCSCGHSAAFLFILCLDMIQ